MPRALEPAEPILSAEGIPYSPRYDDVYHSTEGGLAQAAHVFLGGNGLPQAWAGQRQFVIVETGFGLGLNFLATWQAWRDDPQRCGTLHFFSIEKHPFTREGLARLHAGLDGLQPLAQALQAQWPLALPGLHRLAFDGGRVVLTLALGDVEQMLPRLAAGADAFYLDGFAPARNTEMWSPQVFRGLARLARPGARLATWAAAGFVRRGLKEVGFEVSKAPGFGGKWQMTVARFRPQWKARRHA
ncbi:tRNA (5-methylaminomethyl-2-thiouridine)(34)-methyltransferase MnmD, partial [Cupriavidus sp. SK-4]|uniref:tRNA (5-methylaminomethyl-2-thiouridine)(34)-methyltransferase MnmD n=1 Tax=Cupriavidus sp. SK-4 TaxID=574750 RepID=UPI00056B0D0C